MDVGDSRFAALYTSPEFALDPTDPRFKAGESSNAIIREAAQRKQKQKLQGPKEDLQQQAKQATSGDKPNGNLELSCFKSVTGSRLELTA